MVWFLKANTNDDGLRKANLIKRLSGSSFVTHLVCWSAVFCWACMSKAATGSTEFYKHYYQVSFLRHRTSYHCSYYVLNRDKHRRIVTGEKPLTIGNTGQS